MEQPHELPGEPLGGGSIEQVRRIAERADQRPAALGHRELEIETRARGVLREPLDRKASKAHLVERYILQRERHLTDRLPAEVALGLERIDQLLERQVLMRVGAERRFLDAPDRRLKGGIARKIGPEREQIDEESDQVLGLGAGASGNRASDDEVVLAAHSLEQDLEGGQQHHEQRRAFLSGDAEQGGPQFGRNGKPMRCAAKALHRRPRTVGRHVQPGGRLGEPRGPVSKLRLHHAVRQPGAVPGGVVRILDRQIGKRSRAASRQRSVQGGELAEQHAHRPPVRDDVMDGQHQNMIVWTQREQPASKQSVRDQVERLIHQFARPGAGLREVDRLGREVDGPRGIDGLDPDPVPVGEAGPHSLVAPYDLAQRRRQHTGIERPSEPYGKGDVVGRAHLSEPVQKPQSLLGKRQAHRLAAGHATNLGGRKPLDGI